MTEKATVTLLYPSNLFGSERYTLTIEVINLSDKPLSDINVNAVLIPGKNLSYQEGKAYNDLSKYEITRRELIREINLQVSEAFNILQDKFNHNKINLSSDATAIKAIEENNNSAYPLPLAQIPFSKIFGKSIEEFAEMFFHILLVVLGFSNTQIKYSSNSSKQNENNYEIPLWAKEATKIETWEDLERVEALIINELPDESFLKRTFFANKQKLRLLDDQNSSYRDQNNILRSLDLYPGQTISFTFHCLAPNLLSEKQYDAQFEVSYTETNTQVVGIQNQRKTLVFHHSSFAVPVGTMIGGILGFIVKTFLSSANDFSFSLSKFWGPLLGAIVLSWILATAIMKTDDAKKKFITIEDFTGGIFIGAIAGLFSEQIIEYLKTLIPSSKTK